MNLLFFSIIINLIFFNSIEKIFHGKNIDTKSLDNIEINIESKNKYDENQIMNFRSVDFIKKILLPNDAYAQQGITSDKKSNYYTSANIYSEDKIVSKVFKFNKNLSKVEKVFTLNPEKIKLWNSSKYKPHVGQIAFDEINNYIYVPLMDISTSKIKMIFGKIIGLLSGKPELYAKKTALLVLDENLNYISYINWTNISSYFDAIDINNGKIWFDCGFVGVVDLKDLINNKNKKIEIKKYFLDRKLISKAQGLKLVGNKLYYVPENDRIHRRTEERFWGLLSFDINNLVESKSLRKIINYPEKVYNFSIPPNNADHEAMDFVLENSKHIYISTAADNGKSIYELKLLD